MKIEQGKIKIWEFYKESIHRKSDPELIPTEADLDETKFPALEKLLQQMVKFRNEMSSVKIGLFKEHDTDDVGKGYLLTDNGFQDPYPVSIQFYTQLLDSSNPRSFWPGHTIFFRISQSFHYTDEVRDELVVLIRYLSTTPFHWASCWRHDRFDNSKDSFFYGSGLWEGGSPAGGLISVADPSWNFLTSHFNDAVDILCLATDHLIFRKEHLEETAPADKRMKARPIVALP